MPHLGIVEVGSPLESSNHFKQAGRTPLTLMSQPTPTVSGKQIGPIRRSRIQGPEIVQWVQMRKKLCGFYGPELSDFSARPGRSGLPRRRCLNQKLQVPSRAASDREDPKFQVQYQRRLLVFKTKLSRASTESGATAQKSSWQNFYLADHPHSWLQKA